MKRGYKLILLVMIGCIIIFGTTLNKLSNRQLIQIENGELDLSDYNLGEDGPIFLEGQWLFEWKKWTNQPDEKIIVPSLWGDDIYEKYGYGTYKLTIKGVNKGTAYGIMLSDMMSANQVWIDGEIIHKAGVISDSRHNEIAYFDPQPIYFVAQNEKIEILIYLSNYSYRTGGIWYPPKFGLVKDISDQYALKYAFDMVVIGVLLALGIYHIGQYVNRKSDLLPLYFGLFCILISMRAFVVGERILLDIIPVIPFEMWGKIIYIPYYLSISVFMFYLKNLFPKEVSKRFIKFFLCFCICCSLIVLITPVRIGSQTLAFFNMVTILGQVHVVYVFVLAFIRKRVGSDVMLFAGLFLVTTAIHDILIAYKIIYSQELAGLGIFIFIMAQSYVMSYKFSLTFSEVEKMKEKLAGLNEDLEARVQERTLELKRANKKLQALSFIDGLTQIPNRRRFDEVLKEEWNAVKKRGSFLSLIMLDIDFLKRYNDEYGHHGGDECLKKVATVLNKHTFRSRACAYRYGGEEFSFILLECSKEEALIFAEEARKKIEELKIPHNKSLVSKYVTVSVGVATVKPVDESSYINLIKKADEALYRAKENGRNQVSL